MLPGTLSWLLTTHCLPDLYDSGTRPTKAVRVGAVYQRLNSNGSGILSSKDTGISVQSRLNIRRAQSRAIKTLEQGITLVLLQGRC